MLIWNLEAAVKFIHPILNIVQAISALRNVCEIQALAIVFDDDD